MKALIVGAGGQLGLGLQAHAPSCTTLSAPARADLDIADRKAVRRHIASFAPDIVINAAAYTAVDRAESEPDAARLTNADAAGWLAEAAHAAKAQFAHVSTDFVFDGTTSRPYHPDDTPNPLSVYGRTKLEGEYNVLAACPEALIVRTSWVYAPTGSNFVHTMLRLMAERKEVRVVADQIGTPTLASGLAQALWALLSHRTSGIFHYTDNGVASWHDFAIAIQEEALALNMLSHAIPVTPITTAEYPTPAKRPAFSVLDKTATWPLLGMPAPHWRMRLREMLGEVRAHE